jgi:hypothetical protein
VRSIKFAADGKVAKGSIYVLTSTGLCKKLSKNEPWHESAHYNNIIDCKKASFQARSSGSVESSGRSVASESDSDSDSDSESSDEPEEESEE